ncbi:hypothetical protein D3C87_1236730 [compost metagenome]
MSSTAEAGTARACEPGARRGEFDRIVDQVDQHLPHPLRIPAYRKRAVGQLRLERELGGLGLRAETCRDRRHLVTQIEGSDVEDEGAGVHAGKVEKIVEQAHEAVAARLDLVDEILLRQRQIAAYPILQELGIAEDRGQGRAELMRNGIDEVAFEAVKLFELIVGTPELLGPLGDLGFHQAVALLESTREIGSLLLGSNLRRDLRGRHQNRVHRAIRSADGLVSEVEVGRLEASVPHEVDGKLLPRERHAPTIDVLQQREQALPHEFRQGLTGRLTQ